MRFAWDEPKSRQNLAKHRVSFGLAKRVFDDPLHISIPDPHESEERWRTLGLVRGVVILLVRFTPWRKKWRRNGPHHLGAQSDTHRTGGVRARTPSVIQAGAPGGAPRSGYRGPRTSASSKTGARRWWHFYRPLKEPVTLRLGCRHPGLVEIRRPGYQTRVNAWLREVMTNGSGSENTSAKMRRLGSRFSPAAVYAPRSHGEFYDPLWRCGDNSSCIGHPEAPRFHQRRLCTTEPQRVSRSACLCG